MVTLYPRVTMRRPTAFPAFLTAYKTAVAGAIALAAVLACSEYGTSVAPPPDGAVHVKVNTIDVVYTAAEKEALAAEAASPTSMVPIGPVSNVVVAPTSGVRSVAASCGGGSGAFAGYSKSQVAFAPEPTPNIVPFPLTDDGIIPDTNVPLGFSFNFQGKTYDKVNVYMNGFLLFGTLPSQTNGFPTAGSIASIAQPNNILALAWSDWSPNLVADGIRWETRGTAPNRKFILQFNNVPEFSSASRPGAISPTVGRLMSQVVLSEGSNDITIYTNQLSTTNTSHLITQGIENVDGTVANYDSVLNVVLNRQLPRVRNFFKLTNDAVRFSLISTRDEEKPSITAPSNVDVGNDPGLASAVVSVGSPVASDNCIDVTVTSARSDGKAIDAPYPVGVTTITWTATDAAGNTASASQTVTVRDIEAPVWLADAESVIEVNATSTNGAVVNYDLHVIDNVGVTSVSCVPPSGSIFPIGSAMPVECTASDAAGNSSSHALSVSVFGAHDQIGNLIQDVEALGLPDGTAQPIVNQLLTAYEQTADGSAACKKVSDFLSMVQKKSSNISSSEVTYLTAEATRILNVMGCPPASRSSLLTTSRFQKTP